MLSPASWPKTAEIPDGGVLDLHMARWSLGFTWARSSVGPSLGKLSLSPVSYVLFRYWTFSLDRVQGPGSRLLLPASSADFLS